MTPSASLHLQSRGALQEGAIYIERAADAALREALLARELCYVLAPRQIGKSSLRLRTGRWLAERGVFCAHVDLTELGRSSDGSAVSGWYFGLISKLARQLQLPDPLPFYEQHQALLPVQRLLRYLSDVVLTAHAGDVVVFLDEIDFIRSLAADDKLDTDEFFAAVRACHSARAEDPRWQRLTFCLLGVAAPGDLISAPEITPFNVGRAIRLHDFTRAELTALAPLLAPLGEKVEQWLDAIYGWTNGHPYMTQFVCEQLLGASRGQAVLPSGADVIAARVERTVSARLLRRGRSEDPNLSYAERRLERSAHKADLLALYRRLLAQEAVPVDSADACQLELQLCGLCAPAARGAGNPAAGEDAAEVLVVRNRIFAQVFDLAWLKDKETRHLWSDAIRRFYDGGRDAALLLRGAALAEAQAWLRAHPREVSAEEREFLLASLEAARSEAEERHLASAAALDRERRERAELEAARAAREAERLQALNLALEEARRAAESAQRAAEAAAVRERLAREEVEILLRSEQSLHAAALAAQPGRLLAALLAGLQAALPELRSGAYSARSWEGLLAATQRAVACLPLPHASPVRSAAFSPDGAHIVTASSDNLARVWDATTGALLHTLKGHDAPIGSAVFAPDGAHVLTASSDGTLRIWDAATGAQRGVFIQSSNALAATFSPDGTRVAAVTTRPAVVLMDLQGTPLARRQSGYSGPLYQVVYAPDGDRVLVASSDWYADLLEATQLDELGLRLSGHADAVLGGGFSPDGRQVVTASADRTARIWDAATGRFLLTLQGHYDWVNCAVFTPDGQRVVTASSDRTVRIWDAYSARTVLLLQGHAGAVWSAAVSSDGQRVVTASADGTARLWDLQVQQAMRQLDGHTEEVCALVFSPDGQRLYSGSRDTTCRRWDLRSGESRLLAGHGAAIRSLAVAAADERVLTAGDDGLLRQWAGNAQLHAPHPPQTLGQNFGKIHRVALAPGDTLVVTACEDGALRQWDAYTGTLLQTMTGHRERVVDVAFSPTGQWLISASDDHTARVWETLSGREILCLARHGGRVTQAAFSPDGRYLLTACQDGITRLFAADSGALLLTLRGSDTQVGAAAFSPDGQHVATGSEDGTVRLFHLDSGRLTLALPWHSDAVLALAYSPDGTRLASAGADRRVIVGLASHAQYYRLGCQILQSFADNPDVPAAALAEVLAACPP